MCGLERYKLLARAQGAEAVTPALFEPDRFLDFRASDTNILPAAEPRFAALYTSAEEKLRGGVDVIGDKLPGVKVVLTWVDANFPQARVVCVVREPIGVAASFGARARNPDDRNWAESRDEMYAVKQWNRDVRLALRWCRSYPDRAFVVLYEQLFSGDVGTGEAVLRFTGVQPAPETDDWLCWTKQRWDARHKKQPAITEQARAHVEAHADMQRYEQLRALAASHVKAWT